MGSSKIDTYHLENIEQLKATGDSVRWCMLNLLIEQPMTTAQLAEARHDLLSQAAVGALTKINFHYQYDVCLSETQLKIIKDQFREVRNLFIEMEASNKVADNLAGAQDGETRHVRFSLLTTPFTDQKRER